MTNIKTEKNEYDIAYYGCDSEELFNSIDDQVKFFGETIILMSMLSDAQELITRNQSNEARQLINRAKFMITTYKSGRNKQ